MINGSQSEALANGWSGELALAQEILAFTAGFSWGFKVDPSTKGCFFWETKMERLPNVSQGRHLVGRAGLLS